MSHKASAALKLVRNDTPPASRFQPGSSREKYLALIAELHGDDVAEARYNELKRMEDDPSHHALATACNTERIRNLAKEVKRLGEKVDGPWYLEGRDVSDIVQDVDTLSTRLEGTTKDHGDRLETLEANSLSALELSRLREFLAGKKVPRALLDLFVGFQNKTHVEIDDLRKQVEDLTTPVKTIEEAGVISEDNGVFDLSFGSKKRPPPIPAPRVRH